MRKDEERMPLAPEGVNLLALFAAYDEQQAGMTDEEKERMDHRVVSGKQPVTVSQGNLTVKRAAVRIGELDQKPLTEAEHDVETFLKTSKLLDEPGIARQVALFGRDKTKKD